MSKSVLEEVIQFAIDREQEAVDFYRELAAKVKSTEVRGDLERLAVMEEHHRNRLEELPLAELVGSATPAAQDLRIADYLEEQTPSPEMGWQDVIRIAMKRELASMHLYQDLANVVGDVNGRRLFERLADEEQQHKLHFEEIWDEEVMLEN
jgi:rubrerythrin